MNPLSGRLLTFGVFLARRYGPVAVAAFVRNANAWLADPANDAKKRRLVATLGEWSTTASGTASRTATALARQVERRKVSTSAWERDLMDLRHQLTGMSPGGMRDAAVRAYESQLRGGVHLISHARKPARAREEVMAALRAEASMLRRERLSDDERASMLGAVDAAATACADMFRPEGTRR